MFDHLEKQPARRRRHLPRGPIYLALGVGLFAVCLSLAAHGFLAFSPTTESVVSIRLKGDQTVPRSIVGDQPDYTFATAVISTPTDVLMQSIHFELDGVFLPSNLGQFKLFVDDTQVGLGSRLTADGAVKFIFDSTPLVGGEHELSLRADWISQSHNAQVIAQLKTIELVSVGDKMPILVQSILPLATGLISEKHHGELFAYVVPGSQSQVEQLIRNDRLAIDASFMIGSSDEIFDLSSMTLDYASMLEGWIRTEIWIAGERVNVLSDRDELQAVLTQERITVTPMRPIEVTVKTIFDATSQVDDVVLTVVTVSGRGYASSAMVHHSEPITLATSLVSDGIVMTAAPFSSPVGYKVVVTTLSGDPLVIERVPFTYQTDTQIDSWRVVADGEVINAVVSDESDDRAEIVFDTALELASGSTLEIIPIRRQSDPPGHISLVIDQTEIIWHAVGLSDRIFALQKNTPRVLGAEYVEF